MSTRNPNKTKLKNPRLRVITSKNRKSIEDKISEVEIADADLIAKSFPGEGKRHEMLRELFTAFLASLRPATNTKGSVRSITAYAPGDTLLNLFKSRQYFLEISAIKPDDSLSRLLIVLIDDHQRLITLIKKGDLVLSRD